MPASESKVKANDRYNKKVYESIGLRVRKGTRTEWKRAAEKRGLSLAGLIVTAVTEYLQAHQPDGDQTEKLP